MHLSNVPIPESRDILSLFTPESRARAEANFSWARAHPGQLVRDSFKVRSGRRIITIEVDGSFRFDSEYGGHFFCVLRSSSLEGVSVLNRLQQAYGVTSDAALAQKLRASPARISQTRSGQIPPARDWPTRAYEDTGFSMDWIWTGTGEMRKVK